MSELKHYGILRKSGRYPWGSGNDPYQRSTDLLTRIKELEKAGMSEAKIAEIFGNDFKSTTDLRAARAIASNIRRRELENRAQNLAKKGMSNSAIGRTMGLNESSVRSLLDPSRKDRADVLQSTASALRKAVEEKGYVNVGLGTELHMQVAKTKLDTAVKMLEAEGYSVHNIYVPQVGQKGKYTDLKVLAPPGTTLPDVYKNKEKISLLGAYSEDGGRSFEPIAPPRQISSKTVSVRYAEQGGSKMDGVIELRPGVPELALGKGGYAQVRISVDGTHYLKGMAVYATDLPDGVNIRFNTNKSDTGNKLDAMKPIDSDPEGPFGAIVRQKHYVDASGNRQLSALNIVGSKDGSGEAGAWDSWRRALSSQVLSKQTPALARKQLDLEFRSRQLDYDEIMALDNPVVKKKMLQALADSADSASVGLHAAALPRQSTRVLLPVTSLKDTEVYAPGYRDGERVVLIRHPHGGTFEIPELTVNNRNRAAKSLLGDALDAIGINENVAKRLSGADFDGDAVIVIPNNDKKIKTSPTLKGLKDFDPQREYPGYEGMPKMTDKTKQRLMGDVSNLITDMTIKGANTDEIARAVRHSMVVIDAQKHSLDYKLSAKQNGITALKAKYQNGPQSGASTLISQANSKRRDVPERKLRSHKDGGPIDPVTGEKVYVPTGATKTYRDKDGNLVTALRTEKVPKMSLVSDARKLSSGTVMEEIYASHANKLKALANKARLEAMRTPNLEASPSAKKAYAKEVASLNAKLNTALKNKPLERQAQILAQSEIQAKRDANPQMTESQRKKMETRALTKARAIVGAHKERVNITEAEWRAIQAGAVTHTKLTRILDHTDLDLVRSYATPKSKYVVSDAKVARAKLMLANGHTLSEIAAAMGVPRSTLNEALDR